MTNENLNQIGSIILDAAMTVHKELGPGLLESAYERALFHELTLRGLDVQRQTPVSLKFKSIDLGKAYEIDLLIENEIIIEVKAVLEMHSLYTAQLLTYLKLRHSRLGFL